jgi:hypothetical protein
MSAEPKMVLRRCFTDSEWDWLQAESTFTAESETVQTSADVEQVSQIGAHLIHEAEAGRHPSKRPPPIRPPGKDARKRA